MKVVVATQNPEKLREFRRALVVADLDLVSLSAWPELGAPEETGSTYLDNAVLKALHYHRYTGLPAVGDDSGLEVDALGGAPGVASARWLGAQTPYEVKNARLIESLSGVDDEKRSARFVCALAFADRGEIVFHTVESCEGSIAPDPRGSDGFGYDPIFFYPPFGKTLAEVAPHDKDRVSHRGKALAALARFLDPTRRELYNDAFRSGA